MRFTNLTRATEIGANSYLLEAGGKRIVLDAGMHPRAEGDDALPNFGLVAERSLDAIFLTHAHLDHVGSLPVLMRRQPRAPVFMTSATARLSDIALHNSVNVMTRERGNAVFPGETRAPKGLFFTHRETDLASQIWRECGLGQPFAFDGERVPRGGAEHGEASFEFFDAGHILGSIGVLLRAEGRSVFYTGDINFQDQTISRAASFPDFGPDTANGPLDVLIVETTRGDNPAVTDRRAEETRLGQALQAAFARGGAVLMPVFALGKTQELLAMLHGFRQRGLIGAHVPIYIGGLSTKMTEIYDNFARDGGTPRRPGGFRLMEAVAPQVLSGRDAADAPIKPGRIYALSSGMMMEHTLSYLYAKRMLGDPRHSIFFVGYSAPDSPSGRLRAAKPGAAVALDDDDSETGGPAPATTEVRATVDAFDFSAHADREAIRQFILRSSPKKVLLVHGDPSALRWFQETLRADRPEIEVIIPPPGEAVEL